MKLWIPGGTGIVGSALQTVCRQRHIAVYATGASLDVTDENACRAFVAQTKPTHIINCAAYTAVDRAEEERQRAFAVNALGPEILGKIARDHALPLIHLSTNYVFDGRSSAPYAEEAQANPLSIYGKSKWEGETRLLSIFPQACIIRTSWVFGKEGKNFVSSLLQTLKTEKTMRTATDQSGRITYAHDLAETLLQCLDETGIYHFANHGAVTRYEIAQAAQQAAKRRGIALATQEIIPVKASAFPAPAPRPIMGVLATDKIEKKLTIRPWQETLEEYIQHAL